ncbi:MAG: hypothetical protein HYY06_11490 [Deltaproteobacteria bacterium]|nr:hypothetical protein [Deltaproteobacteria bacterium]
MIGPRSPSSRIVVETREARYPPRPKVHFVPPSEGGKGKWVDDPGGTGREIAREITVCPACAAARRTTAS